MVFITIVEAEFLYLAPQALSGAAALFCASGLSESFMYSCCLSCQKFPVSINLLRRKLSDLQAGSEAVVRGGSIYQEGSWGPVTSSIPSFNLPLHFHQSSFPAHHFYPTCTRTKLSWFLAWFTFKRMSLCCFSLIPHQFINSFPTGRLQIFWLC